MTNWRRKVHTLDECWMWLRGFLVMGDANYYFDQHEKAISRQYEAHAEYMEKEDIEMAEVGPDVPPTPSSTTIQGNPLAGSTDELEPLSPRPVDPKASPPKEEKEEEPMHETQLEAAARKKDEELQNLGQSLQNVIESIRDEIEAMAIRVSSLERAGGHLEDITKSQKVLDRSVLEYSKATIQRLLILNPEMSTSAFEDVYEEEDDDDDEMEYDYSESQYSARTESITANPFFKQADTSESSTGLTSFGDRPRSRISATDDAFSERSRTEDNSTPTGTVASKRRKSQATKERGTLTPVQEMSERNYDIEVEDGIYDFTETSMKSSRQDAGPHNDFSESSLAPASSSRQPARQSNNGIASWLSESSGGSKSASGRAQDSETFTDNAALGPDELSEFSPTSATQPSSSRASRNPQTEGGNDFSETSETSASAARRARRRSKKQT